MILIGIQWKLHAIFTITVTIFRIVLEANFIYTHRMVKNAYFTLWMLTTIFLSWNSWATVSKSDRALIAVVDLVEHARKFPRVYSLEQSTAMRKIRKIARKSYHKSHILSGETSNFANVMEKIEELLRDPQIKRLDMVMYLHGRLVKPERTISTSCFPGADCLLNSELAQQLSQLNQKYPGKLRALYNDTCRSGRALKDFIAAGFQVAAGPIDVDANKSRDLKIFFKHFMRGQTFAHSLRRSNRVFVNKIVDRIIKEAHSPKIIFGNEDVTIND
jgi:hypothetical protein